MAQSILADAPFVQTVFTAPDPDSGSWGQDEWGQDVWIPGSGVLSLAAQFAPFKRTQIEFQPGANPEAVEGRGELVEPLDFPASVRVDSVLQCTFNGRLWDARITNIIPNDLIGVAFGAYFEAKLVPSEAPPAYLDFRVPTNAVLHEAL